MRIMRIISRSKEYVRNLAGKSKFLEVIWLKTHFAKVKLNMLYYNDMDFVNKQYKKFAGENINFSNPTLFSEKLCLLKLCNRDPGLTTCCDKHAVRKYVEECGLGNLLKEEYCAVENAKEIDFEKLPDICYIKTSHGSGRNLVYRKGQEFNKKYFVWKYNYLLKQNTYYEGREWAYKNVQPRIICEEFIDCDDPNGIHELQFFCFDGEPRFIMYNVGLADNEGNHKKATRWVFDVEYNIIPVETSMPTTPNPPPRPGMFDDMVKYARILSKDFPHVRVDLMYANNRVYFGEMTFYSGGGHVTLKPDKWKRTFGGYIDLTGYSIAPDAKRRGFKSVRGKGV